MAIQFDESKQIKKLADIRKQEEEAVARNLALHLGLQYLDLASVPISTDALKLLPLERAKAAHLAPIQHVGKNIQVAAENPEAPLATREIEALKAAGYELNLFIVSAHGLEKAWRMYAEIPSELQGVVGHIEISLERLESFKQEINSLEILKPKIEALQTAKISDLLELIIAGALATDASDVHMEPQHEMVRLRYRIDGVLTDVAGLNKETYKFLSGRVKLVSELTLNIHDKAQDGRFTIKSPGADIEVRVSDPPRPRWREYRNAHLEP